MYERLTTIDGLKSWWTEDVVGDPSPGGRLEFTFGRPGSRHRDGRRGHEPDERITWRGGVGGPAEWVDTDRYVRVCNREPDQTVVLFTHADWREPVEFLSHCSTKWASYLLGHEGRRCEGGKATPFPGRREDRRLGLTVRKADR